MKLYTHTTNTLLLFKSLLPFTLLHWNGYSSKFFQTRISFSFFAYLLRLLQVDHAKTELLLPNTKPINPFSIENILKSEPPSPPSSLDSSDELTDNSESNPNPPTAPVLINSQVAWLIYQSQLQNYLRLLIANSMAQQQEKSGAAIKPVFMPGVYVSPGKAPTQKLVRSVCRMQSAQRGLLL